MAYRFYILNLAGHINGCEVIDAADDTEVLAKAEALKERLAVPAYEIWEYDRKVAQSATAMWR